MLTLLFWNVGGLDRAHICARLARRHNVTVLTLAECVRPQAVLRALNPPGAVQYFYLRSQECRVATFSTLDRLVLPLVEETPHYAIRRLTHTLAPECLLVTTHFPSKLWKSEEDQRREFERFATRVSELEVQQSHTRTLVIGDLNAHPYQRGVVSADGLHAVPTRAIANRKQRTVAGQRYKMFYNPMWRFFGDASPGPPGTYYRWRAEHECVFWYMFDQVLLRPDLLPYFVEPNLEILTTDGVVSFLHPDGTPDPDVGSDHMPVLIRLNYPGL